MRGTSRASAAQIHREHELRLSRRRTLLDISQRIKQGEVLGLNLVLKADVAGSVEVLRDSLEKLSTPEVQVRVIHQGVGAITEGDVLLAAASEAIVIGFHVKPDAKAQAAIQTEKVDVRLYTVIYEVVDEVRSAMSGLLAPELVEKIQGTAEVRQDLPGHPGRRGRRLHGRLRDDPPQRLGPRILRGGEKVWEGKIASLKRIKDDAREVASGFECGIQLEGRDDVFGRRRDRGLHRRGDRPEARVGVSRDRCKRTGSSTASGCSNFICPIASRSRTSGRS